MPSSESATVLSYYTFPSDSGAQMTHISRGHKLWHR